MKKIFVILTAVSLLGITAYAQTQRTNRTNSRTHDRTEVTKEEQPTDQDKNNPDRQTRINTEKNNSRDSVAKVKAK